VGSQAKYENFFRALGLRLKALRRKSGYSQEDMLTFGFSTRHWQQVESGRPVTLTTVLRACDVFQIQPDELLKDLYTPQASEDVNGPLVRRTRKSRIASFHSPRQPRR
jgi:transcriptional regulator with XRE-family HTH domain